MKRLLSRVYTEAFPNTRCFYNVFVIRSVYIYIRIINFFFKLIIIKFGTEKCIIEISYDTEHMHEYG